MFRESCPIALRRLTTWLGVPLAGLAMLTAAPGAMAACGQVAYARTTRSPATGRPPLAIGDSVMFDAVPMLARAGFEADAMICRRMDQGLAMLRARRQRRTLPHLVALALGTNWIITTRDVRRALALLGRSRVLVLVTPRDDEPPRGRDSRVIRAAGRRWPDRVIVLDWAAASGRHRGWLAPDGVHLGGPSGERAFTRLLAQVVPLAADPPVP